jgi:hypothetical protein
MAALQMDPVAVAARRGVDKLCLRPGQLKALGFAKSMLTSTAGIRQQRFVAATVAVTIT